MSEQQKPAWDTGDVWAVTGHRPDKLPDKASGYHHAEQEKVVAYAKAVLAYLHPKTVLTGMALGWDTAVAQACAELSIPFVACVPFEGQESKWSEPLRKRYRELLAKAVAVVVVSPGGYDPKKMHARNAYMVDRSVAVLALWNGTPGGTAGCVEYAKKKGRAVVNAWDGYVAFRETGEFSG